MAEFKTKRATPVYPPPLPPPHTGEGEDSKGKFSQNIKSTSFKVLLPPLFGEGRGVGYTPEHKPNNFCIIHPPQKTFRPLRKNRRVLCSTSQPVIYASIPRRMNKSSGITFEP